jgi:DNA-binding response OmpR family regulator
VIPLCLLISSDAAYVARLQRAFREHGLKLHGLADLASLRPLLAQWRFDAVLCDAEGSAAADLDQTVRWMRRHHRTPVVVLASEHGEDAEISALQAGATDLVPRSASARVVVVRLQRLLDLASGATADEPRSVSLGDLCLDPRRGEAVLRDRALRLTRGEFDLLFLLATRADAFVHREAIVRSVGRGARDGASSRCADMHVCRIRRKLREAGATSLDVETVYGRGYALRLRNDGAPPPPTS